MQSGLQGATLKGTLSSRLGGCRRKDLGKACWCIHPIVTAVLRDLLPSVDSKFREYLDNALSHVV